MEQFKPPKKEKNADFLVLDSFLSTPYSEILPALVENSQIAKWCSENPPRWPSLNQSEPVVEIDSNTLPLPKRLKEEFDQKIIYDDDPIGHQEHVGLIVRGMIEVNDPKIDQYEADCLILASYTHDLPEGLVGDKLSGSKELADKELEHQIYRHLLGEQILKTFLTVDPDLTLQDTLTLTSVIEGSFYVLFAEDKLEKYPDLDKALLGFPPKDIAQRKNSRWQFLNSLYEDAHLLSFVNAIQNLDLNTPQANYLRFEVSQKYLPKVYEKSETNRFFKDFLELNRL